MTNIIILNVAWRRGGWRYRHMRTVILYITLTMLWLMPSRSTLAVRKLCLYGIGRWHIKYHCGSSTWYMFYMCVMLFYVPAPVYVVVSARLIQVWGAILCPGTLVYVVVSFSSRTDCEVCAVCLFNISGRLAVVRWKEKKKVVNYIVSISGQSA